MAHLFWAAIGILLIAGLWTPFTGVLTAANGLVNSVWGAGDAWHWALLVTLGIALCLLGPGAWSVDARLFGWKRIEIPEPKLEDRSLP